MGLTVSGITGYIRHRLLRHVSILIGLVVIVLMSIRTVTLAIRGTITPHEYPDRVISFMTDERDIHNSWFLPTHPSVLTVYAHGIRPRHGVGDSLVDEAGQAVYGDELALRLMVEASNNGAWSKEAPFPPVFLAACWSGLGEWPLAQQLSAKLCTGVIGPTEEIIVDVTLMGTAAPIYGRFWLPRENYRYFDKGAELAREEFLSRYPISEYGWRFRH